MLSSRIPSVPFYSKMTSVMRVTRPLMRRVQTTRRITQASLQSKEIKEPTAKQLRILALRSAVPFVGFGFMDNLVMIQAGEMIDMSIGVTFGLSTLAAAGFGQCFSDVAGITCGGFVDATVSRLNLPKHGLTQIQLDMKVSRICNTLGGCVGVLTGCLLGMSCLFFMDTDRADRAKAAKELKSIFDSITKEGHAITNAERASLWFLEAEKNILWTRVATGRSGIIQIPANTGIVGACVKEGKVLNIPDAYKDERFNPSVDNDDNFHTKSVLAVPVRNDAGKVIGAIEVLNKKNSDGTHGIFQDYDEKLVTLLASHVMAFTRIVTGTGDYAEKA